MSSLTCEENKLSAICGARDHQLTRTSTPLPKTGYLNYILCGSKGSGKSTLILNLLHNKEAYRNFFDRIYIVSPTAKRDAKYDKLLREVEHYDECTSENIIEIMENIKEFNDDFKEKEKERKQQCKEDGVKYDKPKDPHHLIIFDDCIHMLPKSNQKSIVNELFTCNRHYKTSVWTATQKMKSVNPLIRNQCDLLSLWRINNNTEKKGILDEYDISEAIFDFATDEINSFLHVNMFGGRPVFFKKFNKIVIK